MHSSFRHPVVPVAMALRMINCWNHGKRAGPYYIHLHHLASYNTPPSYQLPVQQWKPGNCYQQGILKRHTCEQMQFLRCLWFFVAHFHIFVTVIHLLGVMNITANNLSRRNLALALQSNPTLSQQPIHLPPSIPCIASPQGLDWTSPKFLKLFAISYPDSSQLVPLFSYFNL